jgi:hypothetical protein
MFIDAFKKYGGSILLALGAAALVVMLISLFGVLLKGGTDVIGASLPLIAIGGMILLILTIMIAAIIFSILGLANKDQPMGLPEGSIRAVISLSLIVLFAVLSVFLYKTLSNGPYNTVVNLSETERAQFIRDHADARDIKSVASKDSKGQPLVLKNEDGSPKYFYDVSYRSTNSTSDDFAKQLLVLLGTLMTAVTSFYLGAGTVTSAVVAGQTAQTIASAGPPPTLSGINPTTYEIANGPLRLEVTGANLNNMTHVKIVRAGVQLTGSGLTSSATQIICTIDLSNATAGSWDVVADDGGSKSISLAGALTLT